MSVGKHIVQAWAAIAAFLATSYLSSVAFELINAADDLSVAAGVALVLGLWAAWSYASLRFLQFLQKKKGENNEDGS